MNPILKNLLAILAGCIIGMFVNMGILMLFGNLIHPPEGVDVTNSESIKNGIHLFEFKHFIGPFLAHAGGTLVGALVAAKLAATNKFKIAIGIGFFFLLGGIASAMMIPAPTWFIIMDLALAYIPMGWLASKFVNY
jgi:hypothetical protein